MKHNNYPKKIEFINIKIIYKYLFNINNYKLNLQD